MWTPYINIIPEVDDGDNLKTYYGECEWCGKQNKFVLRRLVLIVKIVLN